MPQPTARHADPNCVFCKIVAGTIPCHKLYEDAEVLAFLDIEPLSRGHCLVIPKSHYLKAQDMPADAVARCVTAAPRLARAVAAATNTDAWNLLLCNGEAAGQTVPHVHFHIIPRAPHDGLGFRWNSGKLDPQDAKKLLAAITAKV